MGLNSKLKAGIEEEEDRISKLPDNILHRILSFLPTKYAVTTSVLSSSWRNLWKAIDVIDIDYHHMLNPSSVGEDTVKLKLFIFFIYGVLKNCDSTVIHKFRLSCPKYIGLSCIRVFVDVACSRNVQELDMDIQFGSVSELSHKLFTCKSLEVLKLRTDYVIHVPPLVGCFPNLKVLHVRFNNAVADFCERFFDGCPKLVDLMIDARPREAIDMCFKISATSLKKLVILLPVDLDYKFSYKFEVDAPELEHLRLQDDSTACSLGGSFWKLKSATLDLGIIDIRHASFEHEFFIVERLNEVVSTRYLSLSLDTTNGLRRLITLPTFYNLTCLRIILHDYIARKTLYSLLKASPKLQILILEMVDMEEKGELSRPLNWPSYAHDCFEKPVCLLQELKVVTMCSFRGQFVERNVIKYFLESAKTLCKMTIYAVDSSVKQKFSKRLLKLPRSSKHCKVEIH